MLTLNTEGGDTIIANNDKTNTETERSSSNFLFFLKGLVVVKYAYGLFCVKFKPVVLNRNNELKY